jgi:hypothetical protein
MKFISFFLSHGKAWVICMLFGVIINARAAQVTLSWLPSESPDVTGYFIHYGTSSGNYTTKVNTGFDTQMTINNLKDSQAYYFTVTAYDAYGDESPPCNEIKYVTPEADLAILNPSQDQIVTLKFRAVAGHWYELQASTDLRNWTDVCHTSVASENLSLQFSDLQAKEFSHRFYRLATH